VTRLFGRRGDERGAILVMATAGIVLAVIAAALAIDTGRLASEKRTDQKVADLAALDAVRELPVPGQVLQAARRSAERNAFPWADPGYDLRTEIGSVDGANVFLPGVGASAVRVTVSSPHENSFLPGNRTVTARAVATVGEPTGQFWLGSKLASFNSDTATILNPIFSDILGTSVAFNAVGYQGVANSTVSLADLVAADSSLGTPDQLLDNSVTVRRLAQATVSALNNKAAGGDAVAAQAATFLGSFASNIDNSLVVTVGDIVNFANPDDPAVATAQFNVFDLLSTAGQKASIQNGNNFVSVPLASNLDLGAARVTLTANLTLIEAGQFSGFGPARQDAVTGEWATTAKTAQVAVDLTARITVGTCPSVLLCVVDLTLPVRYAGATADGSLTGFRCGASDDTSEMDVLVETSAGSTSVSGGSVVIAGLSSVPVSLPPQSVAPGDDTLTFVGPYPTAIQSADPNGLGLSQTIRSIPVLGPVLATLEPVTDALDLRFVEPLFDGLGLSLGGADARGVAIDCIAGIPQLVG
jgi:uncharacterized membrane protein